MQQLSRKARPWLGGNGRAGHNNVAASNSQLDFTPCVLVVHKRKRDCVIGKLVIASPLGEVVLAMPYRNRQTVNHVSIPPVVLAHSRNHGATMWVVRLDTVGACYGLPLAEVDKPGVGWLKQSDAQPEWFVPLASFQPVPWQDWEYVENVVRLREPQPTTRQLVLW